MDFRYLKAFLAVVERQSFSKAAEEINIAQSAVSRQIKLLEESLDEELFIRSSKHLILTAKGKRLYDAIKHFETETQSLLMDEARSLLRIGSPHGLLESWLQNQLGTYYQNYDHNLQITIGDLGELRDGLEAGRFELIFTPYEIDSELVLSKPCLQETFVLVAKHEIELEQLGRYRWISYGPGDHIFRLSTRPPRRMIQVNSMTAILNLVLQGLGIAVLPDHMLPEDSRLFRYRMEELPEQKIFASYHRSRKQPEALGTLLDMLPNL